MSNNSEPEIYLRKKGIGKSKQWIIETKAMNEKGEWVTVYLMTLPSLRSILEWKTGTASNLFIEKKIESSLNASMNKWRLPQHSNSNMQKEALVDS